ncbi:MAG: 23S rRNA (guanosine(2251)-2'-O)-methyltransferase RlmB [Candidatus Binatia bacterium]
MNTRYNLIIGVNPVLEKLKTLPTEISEIFFGRGKLRPILRAIESEAQRLRIKISYLAANDLDSLALGERHQGVIAQVQAYSLLSFSELELFVASAIGPHRILILDGLTDPRNFGAILRTAEAAGVRHIVVPKDRSVGITPAVVKASAGAISHLRIYRVTNLRRAVLSLKRKGFWIVGLDANAPEAYHRRQYPEKLGIVLGNEGHGMRPLISKECDYLVSIPMRGKVSTLNVSVAGAILLYELLRQDNSIDMDSANG